ncbi:MAG: DUF1501 domain-containing protein [Aquabacterium sp.]|nr:DUF1501 domain-containing protein [Aquabacterium sp.]
MSNAHQLQRRAFLKRMSALSALGAAAPLALNLAAVNDAAAFNSADYKALVCIFLYGGNDHANTVVPYDIPNYDRYSAIRNGGPGRTAGGIAFGRNQLTATALTPLPRQTLTDDLQYALAPQLTALKSLWAAGNLAVQLNVGPLVVPLTLAQYNSDDRLRYPLPPRLFSHNDQQSVWQALGAEGASVGWAGRMGDLALSSNGGSSFTSISAGGNAVLMSGNDVLQYQVGPSGPSPVWMALYDQFNGALKSNTLRNLITQPSTNLMENEFSIVTRRALDLQQVVTNALGGVVMNTSFDTDGQPNPLADQLQIVARLIGARNAFGVKRQVFFVQLGGFDNHDNLMQDHAMGMVWLNEAMGQFQKAMVELGVANNVTTFTASDFGRTLSSNGNGTDHGWGGHQFVMGGAVRGGRYFGRAPQVSVTSDDQVGQGRLLPTTSVDQFAATMARWFGVSATELPAIFPNLGNFNTADLGFLA